MKKKIFTIFMSLCLMASSFGPLPVSANTSNGEIDRPMGSWIERETPSSKAAQPLADNTQVIPSAPSNSMARGIDISYHNGNIDFTKVKNTVDFVIIRCGYGSDQTDQDDSKYETYVKGCRDNNIPYGIYLYSYADTEAKSKSEAKHTLRLLNQLKEWDTAPSLPVFYDLEDSKQDSLNASTLATYAQNWCSALEKEGYTTGIYANKNWWTNKLTDSYFNQKIKWIAEWPKSESGANTTKSFYQKNEAGYSMWQYTSQASVSGISGNVDSNYMLKDTYLKQPVEPDQPIDPPIVEPEPDTPVNPPVVEPEPDTPVNPPVVEPEPDTPVDPPVVEPDKPEEPVIYPDAITEGYAGTYDGISHTITIENATSLQYSTDQSTWSKTKPSRKKAGTTTVYYKGKDLNGKSISGSLIIQISPLSIAKASFASVKNKTYTGKAIQPKPVITFNEKPLTEGTDYKLSYGTNKSTGKATIKVTGKGNFNASKTITFYIVPKKVTDIKCSKGKVAKSAKVTWKKVTGASGYQIAYSQKGKNEWSYANVTTLSKTFKNLRIKKYDIKIRAYKTVNDIKKYGSYSAIKSMTAK